MFSLISDENTKFCRVSAAYSSEAAEELELRENDIIEILSKRADGWWTGILRGKVRVSLVKIQVPYTQGIKG